MDQITDPDPIRGLRDTLDGGGLPQQARLTGLTLLRRLSGPVRVAVLGRKGAGKSSVINMLIGAPLIPPGVDLPTLSIAYGPRPRVIAAMPDGELTACDGLDLSRLAALGAQSAQIEAPIPFARHVTLTEPAMPAEPAAQKDALEQALRRADICLWCSNGFGAEDQALWHAMPDANKDHGFLVLTGADRLAARGQLGDYMQALAPVVAQEFHSLYPVATRQALTAWKGGRLTDPQVWSASGGAALANSITAHAGRGRREDLDTAALFVARYGQPARIADAVEITPPTRPKSKQIITGNAAEYCARAVTLLVGSAGRIAPLTNQPGRDGQAAILTQCVQVVEELTDLFAPLAPSNDAGVVDDVQEATEMITLLHLEGGAGPAADALALLAQLKSEFEDFLAA